MTANTSTEATAGRRSGMSALWIVPAIALMALFAGDFALAVPTTCPWKLVTDLPCGGCGMTRAFVAFARGDWVAALGFNPLAPVVALGMVGWLLAALRKRLTGRPMAAIPNWLAWSLLVAFAILHVGRGLGWLPGPGG